MVADRRCASCASTDKIRPCTPAESMAYLYLHTDGPVVDYVPGPDDEQQNRMDNTIQNPNSIG